MSRPLSTHVVAPLAAGIAVYLLFRSNALLVFRWIELAGLGGALAELRALAAPLRPLLPGWFLYSAPDGLWVYAVTSFMCLTWRDESAARAALWIAAGPVLAIGWELAQLLRLVPGTFDPADLVSCAIATGASIAAHRPPSLPLPALGESHG